MESSKTRVRVRFNLNNFIEELNFCLGDVEGGQTERIDDVVQTYKDFLGRLEDRLQKPVKTYVLGHKLVRENEKLKSFIVCCH